MHVTDSYHRRPGACTICNADFKPAIDTGIHDAEGFALYICRVCVHEMGRLFGTLESVDVAIGLRAELDQANEQIRTLAFANESQARALEANFGLISLTAHEASKARAVAVARRNGYDDAIVEVHEVAGTTPPAKPADLPMVDDYRHSLPDDELVERFAGQSLPPARVNLPTHHVNSMADLDEPDLEAKILVVGDMEMTEDPTAPEGKIYGLVPEGILVDGKPLDRSAFDPTKPPAKKRGRPKKAPAKAAQPKKVP